MKNKFTSSAEVFGWLSGFINLEKGQKPKSFRLDRMETLMELACHPQRCAPSIHIAGSKGKGSVTGMTAAILSEAGFRTARYMSPHVIDIRERICLDGDFFSEDIYCEAGGELRHLSEELLPAAANPLFDITAPEGCEPTYWELLTSLFFMCARLSGCNVMVVETGLGGRLDSTNVLEPLASVITLIELEHTNFLGNTITAIAGEKAGIIKPGKPLILARQCEEALQVFKKKAGEKNSQLYYFPDIAELSNINISPQGTDFTLLLKEDREYLHSSFSIPLPGKVQAENAALAIAALQAAGNRQKAFQIDEETIRKGLARLKIPARFEKIGEEAPQAHQGPFIIDGAHTPESLTLCIETFCSLYGRNGVLLFGCAADKDAAAMAKIAYSHFAKIIITTPGTFKASDPAQVFEVFAAIAGLDKTELVLDTMEAARQAIFFADSSPILATGSFYLAAEVRRFVTQKI